MFDSPRLVHPVSAYIPRSFLCATLALAAAIVQPASGAAAVARHVPKAHVPAAHLHAPAAHSASAPRIRTQSPQREQARSSASHWRKAATQQASTLSHVKTSRADGMRAVSTLAKAHSAQTASKVPQPERLAPSHSSTVQQQAVEDRVHAWYQARHPESSPRTGSNPQDNLKASEVRANNVPANAPAMQAAAPVIRLSPAALQSDEALHAFSATQPSVTSTDDSAAIAEESHIPRTAPTERTSAPFAHGDFNVTGAAGNSAPVLRASSPAGSALLSSRPRLDPVPVQIAAQQAVTISTDSPTPVRFSPADQDAANSASLVKVNLYDSAGKLILIPPMKGTHEILVHQNQMAVADGLLRITNDAQLNQMRRLHLLVALPETAAMGVDERLPLNRRYSRPWSARFLNDLARAHYAWFHTPLIVTSAVRTVAFQRHLVMVNGNAAPPTGDIASPHLYGQAVDIAKHNMSTAELAWMRAYLTPLEAEGKIDVEEEFQQACFHISVYRSYLGAENKQSAPTPELPRAYTVQQAKATPAKRRHVPTALLAMRLR